MVKEPTKREWLELRVELLADAWNVGKEGSKYHKLVLVAHNPGERRYQIHAQDNRSQIVRCFPSSHWNYRDFDNYLTGLIEGSENK